MRFRRLLSQSASPLGGPAVGLMPETVSAVVPAATYTNRSADDVAEVPVGLVTVTSTAPGPTPAGLSNTIWVLDSLRKLVVAIGPKATDVTVARFVPTMLTKVPPANGPLLGLTPETVGP